MYLPKQLFKVFTLILVPDEQFKVMPKQQPVNAHEISLDVTHEHITVPCIVGGALCNEAFESADAEKGPFPFAARITIINEFFLEERFELFGHVMLVHPVPEFRSEYFPEDRTVDKK